MESAAPMLWGRIKTKSFELPFDIASSDEARQLLKDWDVSRTDALLAERQKVVETAQESMVKNEEERRRLQRARQFAKMEQLIEDGNKEELELALLDLQPGEVNTLRDGKGNALLHVAASKHKPEICIYLVEEAKAQVDSRDAKGWTALMVAALAGAKRVCIELLARGANPALENAYRKTALDLAKTDEVTCGLFLCCCSVQWVPLCFCPELIKSSVRTSICYFPTAAWPTAGL